MKILEEVAEILKDRRSEYGSPNDCFDRIAKLWSSYLDKTLSSSDVAHLMMLYKIARLKSNPHHPDSLKDVIGYAVCARDIADLKPYQEERSFLTKDIHAVRCEL